LRPGRVAVNRLPPGRRAFDLTLSALGGLLVLFVLLPLGGILLTLDPRRFWLTLIDTEVLRSVGLTVLAAAIATAVDYPGGADCLWPAAGSCTGSGHDTLTAPYGVLEIT
jgi:ABC-type sulfate transport system permease component